MITFNLFNPIETIRHPAKNAFDISIVFPPNSLDFLINFLEKNINMRSENQVQKSSSLPKARGQYQFV